MGLIGPVIAKSGLSVNHRYHFAQVNEVLVASSGHEATQVINTRTGTAYDLGIPAPTAAPTNSNAAGALTGTFIYRVRWRDASTSTNSLASATLTLTLSAQTPTITRPGSPPSRATHWILERTTNGGATYYPVNRTTSAPNGTAIASTTYADTTADATLRARTSLPDTQGVPVPYRFPFSNQQRIFFGGGRVHRVTATLTNSSTAVTGGSDFNAYMVGQDLSADGDLDGVTYPITAYGSATALTLGTAYAGTTGGKTITISGRRDIGAWSEANRPEEFGSAELSPNGLSNEIQIGSDGEPLTGGVGLGVQGVLWTKLNRMFFHYYTLNPNTVTGDGRLVEVPIRRGACAPKAVRYIDGWIYGIDLTGIWRMKPGGVPEDISGPISNDWKSNQLYFGAADNWFVSYHPVDRTVYFWVTLNTDDYPRHSYVWSIEREAWVGTMPTDLKVTSDVILPDSRGILRMCLYNKSTSGAGSYLWSHGIGVARGADKAQSSPLYGTVTSSTSTTSYTVTYKEKVAGTGECSLTLSANSSFLAGDSITVALSPADVKMDGTYTITSVDGSGAVIYYTAAPDAGVTGQSSGGTVAGASGNTLTSSGAAWQTTNDALTGCTVETTRASDGTAQTATILSNTASVLTVASWPTYRPAAGDTYALAPIHTVYRTGRISFGQPDRKMKSTEVWIWARYASNSIPFKMRVYYDGSTTAQTDIAYTRSEDGVSWTASSAAFTIDPTVQIHHFRIPLGAWKRDVQLEFYSDYGGEPWTIYGIKLRGEVDESADPRR